MIASHCALASAPRLLFSFKTADMTVGFMLLI